ncbi:chromosomal replication initiator protein DnaA [bacterium]|nr:chromosomal replication initiator protein DnaA [bacterium]
MDIQEVAEIWQKVKQELSESISESSMMWVEPLEPIGFENNCFTLLSGHSLAVNLLTKNNREDFLTAFKKIFGKDVEFEILLDENLAKKIKKEKERQAKRAQKDEENKISNLSQMQSFSNLNLKYKFENFVVGSNNEFAQAAAMAVAKNPAPAKKGYNPLFIYGASGLGKTHLMQAIGHYILFNSPKLRVKYIKTEDFTNDLTDNLRKGGDINERMNRFRQKYRNVDVLLLDDIQFIESKERTMEEVFHTFDSLYNKNKQIVITSDRKPEDIPSLPERLSSRFSCGLVVDLMPPEYETRLAILKNLADNVEVKFSNEVLELIAKNFKKNVRELEGAFNKICAYATIKELEPNIETTKHVLKLEEKKKTIHLTDIVNKVCDEYKVTEEDLKSSARSQSITIPRQIAIYLIREILNLSYEEIAEYFNKKHPTMLYGYEQIKQKIRVDNELKSKIKKLKTEIKK